VATLITISIHRDGHLPVVNRSRRRLRAVKMREFGPVMTPFEAAKRISECGRPITTRTMDNWRHLGIGPRFIRVGGRILYPVKFMDEWWDIAGAQSRFFSLRSRNS
jgi:hypothetical protein